MNSYELKKQLIELLTKYPDAEIISNDGRDLVKFTGIKFYENECTSDTPELFKNSDQIIELVFE